VSAIVTTKPMQRERFWHELFFALKEERWRAVHLLEPDMNRYYIFNYPRIVPREQHNLVELFDRHVLAYVTVDGAADQKLL